MLLSEAYNSKQLGVIQSLIHDYMMTPETPVYGLIYKQPSFLFFNTLFVFCEYTEGKWWWTLSTSKDTYSIQLYMDLSLLSIKAEDMTSELAYKCSCKFIKDLLSRRWLKESGLWFHYWEYLRLCICIKHRLLGASTFVNMSVIRACNEHLKILTEREINDIGLEAILIPMA